MEIIVFLRVKIFPKYGFCKIIYQIAFLFANFKATSISSEMGLKKISENLYEQTNVYLDNYISPLYKEYLESLENYYTNMK